jgi:diguanylate cyclase (GGDEF)-like protein
MGWTRMNLFDLLLGPTGRIYASSSIIIMLSLMFIMSFRLYVNRRKKAYFSFMASLVVMILQYLILIWLDLQDQALHYTTDYLAQTLQVVSFILINMGIYQLYNRSKTKEHLIFTFMLALAFFIVVLHYYFIHSTPDPTREVLLLHDIWMDLYLFLLIFLCFYLVTPFIGQTLKYQLGLTVYFITHLAHTTNKYIFNQPVNFLSFLENFMPVLFYGIVFLFIFDRVVELLQAVYQSSITDGLTGVYNRKFFFQRVQQYVQRERNIAVIFCDIDNFKKLNDTQGHQKGDEVLKQVASILKQAVEEIGVVGRYGGEELVVLLTDTKTNPQDLAEQIRDQIETETTVTVSVGYSKFKKGINAEKLINQADHAMYTSKKTGKNKVTAYSSKIGMPE